MKPITRFLVAGLLILPTVCPAASAKRTVKTVNPLPLARASQTLELSSKDLAPLNARDLETIHVTDASGKEVVCQAVDTDYDDYHKPDIIIFQSDFVPNETKSFSVSIGAKHAYQKQDFKAYGRFVRERFDDFAWENDRIAQRTYGKALETWKGEPLTSSAIDVWSKRVSYPVIDQWYMLDNYHADGGEGLDDYSAGSTRGDGGDGLWANDKLYVPKNFVDSRVLANGPIRVLFELVYEDYDVNGAKVSEVRRISLDAGSQLDHYQIFHKFAAASGPPPVCAVGLKKVRGEEKQFNAEHGWLAIWEPMENNLGYQGVAAIVDPKTFVKQAEDEKNNLLLVNIAAEKPVSYWAGFAWDRAGFITAPDAWKKYVDEFSQGLRAPIQITVTAE